MLSPGQHIQYTNSNAVSWPTPQYMIQLLCSRLTSPLPRGSIIFNISLSLSFSLLSFSILFLCVPPVLSVSVPIFSSPLSHVFFAPFFVIFLFLSFSNLTSLFLPESLFLFSSPPYVLFSVYHNFFPLSFLYVSISRSLPFPFFLCSFCCTVFLPSPPIISFSAIFLCYLSTSHSCFFSPFSLSLF